MPQTEIGAYSCLLNCFSTAASQWRGEDVPNLGRNRCTTDLHTTVRRGRNLRKIKEKLSNKDEHVTKYSPPISGERSAIHRIKDKELFSLQRHPSSS